MFGNGWCLNRRSFLGALLAIGLLPCAIALAQPFDPLPSWNDGPAKQAILSFVENVTHPKSANFVPEAERIATFDNDGTLWVEQPIYVQFAFAMDRLKELSASHPEWKDTQPFKAALEGDLAALAAFGEKGVLEIIAATHAGMTTDDFAQIVRTWITQARHPTLHRPYTSLVYEPMLELLSYLRSNGFKTYIVSGGGVEFMRPWTERVYGIPPEQVIGSAGVTRYQFNAAGEPEIIKEPKVEFIDDGPGKAVGINRMIGRRPILAFGNSDGDQQMLEWTAAGDGARFMGLVHHTDAVREWAYDRHSRVGKLDKALDEANARGWTVVDMKNDWRTIFPPIDRGVGGGALR